jgi:hypothetical protein
MRFRHTVGKICIKKWDDETYISSNSPLWMRLWLDEGLHNKKPTQWCWELFQKQIRWKDESFFFYYACLMND